MLWNLFWCTHVMKSEMKWSEMKWSEMNWNEAQEGVRLSAVNSIRQWELGIMVNIYTCFRGNKTCTKYWLKPTDINEYLEVTMEDAYDGDDADELMIDHLNTQI